MATGRIPTTANSPLTAKGDLFTFSTGSAKLAVGGDGETLVADSSTATGLAYREDYAAGKNKIINGNFNVWQRGTSFSLPASNNVFTADRWQAFITGTTSTASQQAFTPGTAPVSGYESQYFHRIATGAATTYYEIQQRIEDVRTLANQTATYSFWAKASNAHVAAVYINQNFGVSGSTNVGTAAQNISLTTSFQRFTLTFTIGSISGKTIGASSYLNPFIYYVSGTVASTNIDIWGVQLEEGSVATAFNTATGTIQGELAACQRYYVAFDYTSGKVIFNITSYSTTLMRTNIAFPVTMRAAPTFACTNSASAFLLSWGFGLVYFATMTLTSSTVSNAGLEAAVVGSGNAGTAAQCEANATVKLEFRAEL